MLITKYYGREEILCVLPTFLLVVRLTLKLGMNSTENEDRVNVNRRKVLQMTGAMGVGSLMLSEASEAAEPENWLNDVLFIETKRRYTGVPERPRSLSCGVPLYRIDESNAQMVLYSMGRKKDIEKRKETFKQNEGIVIGDGFQALPATVSDGAGPNSITSKQEYDRGVSYYIPLNDQVSTPAIRISIIGDGDIKVTSKGGTEVLSPSKELEITLPERTITVNEEESSQSPELYQVSPKVSVKNNGYLDVYEQVVGQ
ncbi:hypothetical protein [Haloferax sp. YSMS24]|uniref:hypothetical protein n=1 Tax=unclassified Haloferax TaxID=2625095 RepID=UPI00398C9799